MDHPESSRPLEEPRSQSQSTSQDASIQDIPKPSQGDDSPLNTPIQSSLAQRKPSQRQSTSQDASIQDSLAQLKPSQDENSCSNSSIQNSLAQPKPSQENSCPNSPIQDSLAQPKPSQDENSCPISPIQSSPAQCKPPATLLGLPRKLRDKIYRYALPRFDIINPYHIPRARLDIVRPPQLGLLGVNKQISAEASDIFYRENRFRIPEDRDHFRGLMSKRTRRIRHCTVTFERDFQRENPSGPGIYCRQLMGLGDESAYTYYNMIEDEIYAHAATQLFHVLGLEELQSIVVDLGNVSRPRWMGYERLYELLYFGFLHAVAPINRKMPEELILVVDVKIFGIHTDDEKQMLEWCGFEDIEFEGLMPYWWILL